MNERNDDYCGRMCDPGCVNSWNGSGRMEDPEEKEQDTGTDLSHLSVSIRE